MRGMDMMAAAEKWGLNRARIIVIVLSLVLILAMGLVFVVGIGT